MIIFRFQMKTTPLKALYTVGWKSEIALGA
jgi:hypothetical protein